MVSLSLYSALILVQTLAELLADWRWIWTALLDFLTIVGLRFLLLIIFSSGLYPKRSLLVCRTVFAVPSGAVPGLSVLRPSHGHFYSHGIQL